MAEGCRPTIRPGTDGRQRLAVGPVDGAPLGPLPGGRQARSRSACQVGVEHGGRPLHQPLRLALGGAGVVLEPHARPVGPLADAGELEVGVEAGDRQVVGPADVAQLEAGRLDRQALGERRVVLGEGRRRVLDAASAMAVEVALAPGVEERLGVVGGLGRVVAEQLGHPVHAAGHDRGHHQDQDEGEHPAVVEHQRNLRRRTRSRRPGRPLNPAGWHPPGVARRRRHHPPRWTASARGGPGPRRDGRARLAGRRRARRPAGRAPRRRAPASPSARRGRRGRPPRGRTGRRTGRRGRRRSTASSRASTTMPPSTHQ